MTQLIAAIDQGTTSSRCMLFDRDGRCVSVSQQEHQQIYPQPGWVEHDPMEVWQRTSQVIQAAMSNVDSPEIQGIGITNQRETTVVWDKETGQPISNAIVWQCMRTEAICNELRDAGHDELFKSKTGLPLATYFAGPKIRWLLDNVEGARERAEAGKLLFGTMDTWIIWWLTGGPDGGVHVTDPTNASRTMLMDLDRVDWDDQLLGIMRVPRSMLPAIRPSSMPEGYGVTTPDGPFAAAIPVCGDLGDQQAALMGQACFEPGDAKNTYGTGCFLLMNTGLSPQRSNHGLLTTVAYQLGDGEPHYALEGSIAIAGAAVQWLRDNLQIIRTAPEVEDLANTVDDNCGVFFVPAFSGLFAPHWRSDARGVIVGLTRYANKGHIARATLEAICYQTREVLDAMNADSGIDQTFLRVDGGASMNRTLMQLQSDILSLQVVRPQVNETTALGAAYAAGLAVGFWGGLDELRDIWKQDQTFEPGMSADKRSEQYAKWQDAVARTLNWV